MTRIKYLPAWLAIILMIVWLVAPSSANATPAPAANQAVSAPALTVPAVSTTVPPGVRLRPGTSHPYVQLLQHALAANKWGSYFKYGEQYTNFFGGLTERAFKSWEADYKSVYPGSITRNGEIVTGSAEWNLLMRDRNPNFLPPFCDNADVVCVNKMTEMLRYARYGIVLDQFKVKLGRPGSETPIGTYVIFDKFDNDPVGNPTRKDWSYEANVYMHWALKFDLRRGLYIHYSSVYFARGEAHLGSAGCINVRYEWQARKLNMDVREGRTAVMIYG